MSSSSSREAFPTDEHAAAHRMAELICGRWISMAIGAAAELGFADQLGEGTKTSDQLAEELGTHAFNTYRLLRALTRVGVFREEEGRRFSNTPMSNLLRTGPHPAIRHMARSAVSSFDPPAWGKIVECVRTGTSGTMLALGMSQKQYFAQQPADARFFAETMTSYTADEGGDVARAYDFSKVGTLVDVGGGEGNLLGSLLRQIPGMRGILLDLPDQVESAPAVLARYGVADRCTVVGGDFFREVPAGGDAYLMRRTLHNWGDADAVRILETIHEAAKPGAKLLIVEIMLEHPQLLYGGTFVDLAMMVVDEGGRQRTRADFESIMKSAGFRFEREYSVDPTPFSVLEGVRK